MLRTLVVAIGVAATAAAQDVLHPVVEAAHAFDSTYLGNPGEAPVLLWTQDVAVGGDWIQVHCRDSNLPDGSHLRIYSPQRPAWAQWHDAGSLRDYDGWSAQFVGPSVRVELWGAPNSTGNRVWVDRSRSTTFLQGGFDTICDGVDDRMLCADPRACRLGTGCSAWLFSEYAVASAGHCMNSGTTSGVLLHFNVPLSTAAGVPQPAHPNDQYALGTFLQFLDQGIGQDWSTMAAVRNSNTGLFPGQAQGSWYTIAAPGPVGSMLRVTGYGTGNGTSTSATANQVQKTHTGPQVATAVLDAVAYRADTTGGNSGSPVLHEATGEVVAVHTHGGCTNGSGQNSGTTSSRPDWTAARQAVLGLHTVGGFGAFGQGCGGAFGVPSLGFSGIPELGRVFSVRVGNLNPAPGLLGILVVGFSTAQWSGGPLPAALSPLGLQGCNLYVSAQGVEGMAAANGVAVRSYFVPNDGSWLGASLHYQYLGLDPTGPNAVGGVASNAGTVRFGN